MDKCKQCGRDTIVACVRKIGFPDYHVKGARRVYCGFCDEAPELTLRPGGSRVLVSDKVN